MCVKNACINLDWIKLSCNFPVRNMQQGKKKWWKLPNRTDVNFTSVSAKRVSRSLQPQGRVAGNALGWAQFQVTALSKYYLWRRRERKLLRRLWDLYVSWLVLVCCCLCVCFTVMDDEKGTLFCLVFESLRGFSPVCCDSFLRCPR